MSDEQHTIEGPQGQIIPVTVRRDRRLKKSARWTQQRDGSILLRVPLRLPSRQIARLLLDIAAGLEKQRRIAGRTDADLQARAEHLNRACFAGAVRWEAIRWVDNMRHRLGSCTSGGPTDGHIRISSRIKGWPQWVIDYIIAHELAHRIHPDHSPAFWDCLNAAYPLAERARGFIDGVSFAEGQPLSEDD